MAVTLPPWLALDPLAPARIRLQANQQRLARDAASNANQARFAEMQLRREQMAQHAATQEKSLAARERAAQRHDEVLRQTRDAELAQTAANMQLRREAQAAKTEQFQQTLRLKQQAAEKEAKDAAQQMQGMRAVQEGLKAGQPIQKLIAENAPMLFAGKPERMAGGIAALNRGVTAPGEFVAKDILDQQGQPTGIRAIPGAHGSIKPLPRTELTPEGLLRADQMRLGVIRAQLLEAPEGSPEQAQLLRDQREIMQNLKDVRSRRGAVSLPPGVPTPGAPASAPAPSPGFVPGPTTQAPVTAPAAPAAEDTIMLQSPDGKTGTANRSEWEAASPEQKKGWKEVSAGKLDEEAEAADMEEEVPLPEEEEE